MGPPEEVFTNPRHPYTRALLAAAPVPDPRHRRTQPLPAGEIPNPINTPPGCAFHFRCPIAREGVCDAENPELLPVEASPEHLVSCHLRTGNFKQNDPERHAPAGMG